MSCTVALALVLACSLAEQTTAARQVAPIVSTHCAATPLQKVHFPRRGLETLPWLVATPAAAGITAHLFFAVLPTTRFFRVGPLETAAALYPHGTMPGGASIKVLWVITNPRAVVLGPLTIDGRNVAGHGTMHQLVPRAVNAFDYPSIVNIPTPGCWQLHLQIASYTGARTPFKVSVTFVVIKE
jgi:hypothetical protein